MNILKLTIGKENNNLLHSQPKIFENEIINKPSPEIRENLDINEKFISNLDSLSSKLSKVKILLESPSNKENPSNTLLAND
jgi:hypothetical protein